MPRWRRRVASRWPHLNPPCEPEPERLETARQAAEDAELVLAETLGRTPEVEARARKAERIHRQNNLGPSFWKAIEGRRA